MEIQTRIGGPALGMRKQIVDDKNGFIVKSFRKLAQKIIFLLANPGKRKKMDKLARKPYQKNSYFPAWF